MWNLDHKEGWVLKNWCFQTMVLEKTLESPLDRKVKPVNPTGNQPWIFIGRHDAEAPILWPHDAKSWFIGNDPDAGKDWRQRGWQTMRWLDGTTDSKDRNLSKLQRSWRTEELGVLQSMGPERGRHVWAPLSISYWFFVWALVQKCVRVFWHI